MRTILGLTEEVTVNGNTIVAKIDTGAVQDSLEIALAGKLNVEKIIGSKIYINAEGRSRRSVVKIHLTIKGCNLVVKCNLADRSHSKYPLLIGSRTLKKLRFLIDPNK